MSTRLMCLFVLQAVLCLDYEVLQKIADTIEQNIATTFFRKRYSFQVEDLSVELSHITPLFSYKIRRLSNSTKDNEYIRYQYIYLSVLFNITVTQQLQYSPKVTNQLFIDKTISNMTLTRNEDNSFSFSLGKTEKLSFKKSYLFFYKQFKPLVEQGLLFINAIDTAINEFFTFLLSQYPLSFTEYYFKRFIEGIQQNGLIPYTPPEEGRDMAIDMYKIGYSKREKVDKVNDIYHKVVINAILSGKFVSYFFDVYIQKLRFGQDAIEMEGITHDCGYDSFLPAFQAFIKGEYLKHNFSEKFQKNFW